MSEAYNEEEVDILKYGQGRSILKEKQKKIEFFQKKVLTLEEKRGIIYKLSGEDTAER